MKYENKKLVKRRYVEKMKKIIATILSAAFLLSPLNVMAFSSRQIINTDPAVLPGNPLYGLKSFTQGIQNFFINNPVKKVMFNVHVLNQKGAEIALSEEIGAKITDQALNEYATTANALVEKISNLTPEIALQNLGMVFGTNSQLLDYLLERAIIHIRLHDQIFNTGTGTNALKESRLNLEKSIHELLILDSGLSLEQRIRMIAQSQGSDFALQFIETEGDANFGS